MFRGYFPPSTSYMPGAPQSTGVKQTDEHPNFVDSSF